MWPVNLEYSSQTLSRENIKLLFIAFSLVHVLQLCMMTGLTSELKSLTFVAFVNTDELHIFFNLPNTCLPYFS